MYRNFGWKNGGRSEKQFNNKADYQAFLNNEGKNAFLDFFDSLAYLAEMGEKAQEAMASWDFAQGKKILERFAQDEKYHRTPFTSTLKNCEQVFEDVRSAAVLEWINEDEYVLVPEDDLDELIEEMLNEVADEVDQW